MKAGEFGFASDHANTVRLARQRFINTTLEEQMSRASLGDRTRLVDHMIAMGHLSTKFFADYSREDRGVDE